jgi:hypothetical protein
MTDIQDRLFDVTEYGGDEPTPKEKPKPPKPEPIVEAWQDPWVLLRGRSGVLPFFHLEASRNEHGAVASVCGIVGTRITNDMVTQMIRCPLCDMGAQLA